MNNCNLAGRILTVPKIRMIQPKNRMISVCSFVLGVPDGDFWKKSDNDKNSKDDIKKDFFECIAFDDVATMINDGFIKGSKILLTGKFKNYCFYDCNKTRHFTNVFVINHAEYGDTGSVFDRNTSAKHIDKTIESDLISIFKDYEVLVESGFACVDEDDYYRLAFNAALDF